MPIWVRCRCSSKVQREIDRFRCAKVSLGFQDDKSFIFQPLHWLPKTFPQGVHVIVSTCTSHKRSMKDLIDVRKSPKLLVAPLTTQLRNQMCAVSEHVPFVLFWTGRLSPVQCSVKTSSLFCGRKMERVVFTGSFEIEGKAVFFSTAGKSREYSSDRKPVLPESDARGKIIWSSDSFLVGEACRKVTSDRFVCL